MKNSVCIPSLEDYAKDKRRFKDDFDMVNCLECPYCKPNLQACIYGNNVRALNFVIVCPRSFKKHHIHHL